MEIRSPDQCSRGTVRVGFKVAFRVDSYTTFIKIQTDSAVKENSQVLSLIISKTEATNYSKVWFDSVAEGGTGVGHRGYKSRWLLLVLS